MHVGEICNREVVVVGRTAPVREAAELMRRYHVGDLVVVDEVGGKRVPAGIVTDRDLVVEVVAMGLNPEAIRVGDVMGAELVTAGEGEHVHEVIQRMRSHGVRRVPVVDAQGALAGIVSAADLSELLGEELADLNRVFYREKAREAQSRK